VPPPISALSRPAARGVRPDGIDQTNEPIGCGGPTVTTTTLPYVTIETTSFKLSDGPTPASRRVAFTSSTTRDRVGHRILVPASGSAGDPTIGGGILSVYKAAGTGETTAVVLPASGWSIVGSPGRVSGYRFRDPDRTAPISSVQVQADRLRVRGGGPKWSYTLGQSPQGRVAVRLMLGSDGAWCATALAKPTGSPATTARTDRTGLFAAQPKMGAPLVCPPVP